MGDNQNKGNYRTWMRTGIREMTEHGRESEERK